MLKILKKQYSWGIIGGVAIAVLGGVWCVAGSSKAVPVEQEIPVVKTQVVSVNGSGQSYSYSGEVRGRYESQLAFQVSGKVTRRNVGLGSVVKAGETLVRIDPVDYRQGVDAAQAQLAAAESQYKLAKDNLERFKEIYNQKLMSQAEFDQYQSAYESAAAVLRQAKAQYTQGANQLNYCNLVADGDGVVAGVYAETGQVVAAGQPVVALVKGREREIEINVPENRLASFNAKQQFTATFWALPGVSVNGQVREVAPMADEVTRTYKVRISLVNPPAALKVGMTATISASGNSGEQAMYIPLSAIYQPGNTPGVWVVRQGVVNWKPVQLGPFGEQDTVKVMAGLKQGDVIVTAGVHKLREKDQVHTERS